MKKQIITSLAIVSLTIPVAYGQGTFLESNQGLTFDSQVIDSPVQISGVNVSGTQYHANVIWGAGANASSLGPVTGLADALVGDASPGYISPTPQVAIPGAAIGSHVTLQLQVWDFTTGSTWANATLRGQSVIDNDYTLQDPGVPAPNPFWGIPTADGNPPSPIALTPVPEPSTFALIGLGTGALLFLRRRK